MNPQAHFLDFSLAAMSSAVRPLDFATIARYKTPAFTRDSLILGARRAHAQFPKSHSVWSEGDWQETQDSKAKIQDALAEDEAESTVLSETFLARKIDLGMQPPLEQLLIHQKSDDSRILVTRLHHAAGDLISLAMWLEAQLGTETSHHSRPLQIKTSNSRVSKSQFSHWGASESLWREPGAKSNLRRWRTITLDAEGPRKAAKRLGKFTYNDVLTTAVLESSRLWNERHRRPGRKISVWLPVNVRRQPFEGFGNGTSRIRIYASPNDLSFADKCAATRRQVQWSKSHGEWVFPQQSMLTRMPSKIGARILRAYFHRPWVDMGTILFSHAERWSPLPAPAQFHNLQKLEVVVNLHVRHPLGIAAVTQGGLTRFTFTYDPAILKVDQVDDFIAIFQRHIEDFAP